MEISKNQIVYKKHDSEVRMITCILKERLFTDLSIFFAHLHTKNCFCRKPSPYIYGKRRSDNLFL